MNYSYFRELHATLSSPQKAFQESLQLLYSILSFPRGLQLKYLRNLRWDRGRDKLKIQKWLGGGERKGLADGKYVSIWQQLLCHAGVSCSPWQLMISPRFQTLSRCCRLSQGTPIARMLAPGSSSSATLQPAYNCQRLRERNVYDKIIPRINY